MENEQVYENNFISSNDKTNPRRGSSPHRHKVIISVDNLRCTAYRVEVENSGEDPDNNYTEDTFEIIEYWPARLGDSYSKTDLEAIDQIESVKRGEKDPPFVEFRFGTYIAQSTWSRKGFKK